MTDQPDTVLQNPLLTPEGTTPPVVQETSPAVTAPTQPTIAETFSEPAAAPILTEANPEPEKKKPTVLEQIDSLEKEIDSLTVLVQRSDDQGEVDVANKAILQQKQKELLDLKEKLQSQVGTISEVNPIEPPVVADVKIAIEEPSSPPIPAVEPTVAMPTEAVTEVPSTAVEVSPKSRQELERELEEAVQNIAAFERVMKVTQSKGSGGGSHYTILQQDLDEEIKNRDYLTTKLAEIPTVESAAAASAEPVIPEAGVSVPPTVSEVETVVSPAPVETIAQFTEPIPPITETMAPVETVQTPAVTVPPESPASVVTAKVNEPPPTTPEQPPQKRRFFGLFQKKTPPSAPVQPTSTAGSPVQVQTLEKYSP